MRDDKTRIAIAILGGKKKPHSEGEMSKDDDEKEAGEKAAASDMIDAFKAGDPASLASSLKNFIEICYPSLAKDEDEESESY